MNARQSKRALDIVSGALERDPEARQAFVEAECADDSAVRGEVDRLFALSKEGEGIGFLEQAPQLTVKAVVTDPLIGRCVGPYKILEVLGQGGMGVVYLAEQTEPIRRRVALKLIKLGMDTARVVSRFETERQALATMDHPGVAKVLDAGSTEHGRPYFVMEYVDGTRITEYCDRNRLDTTQRLELFMQICQAVQHAHQKGIIHRDIKPSNVLVTVQDGKPVPKVIDFGVAKATERGLTEETLFTEHGQLIGTPTYMSPEQAEMTAQDIDTRSDIYSLGVLLYELLTGVTPLDLTKLRREAVDEIRRMIREDEPLKPSTKVGTAAEPEDGETVTSARNRRTTARMLSSELRGDLDWITMRAMEKDRTRRYASAWDFAADIRRHLDDEVVIAGPPSSAYRDRKFVRRNRGLVAAVVAVLVTLAAGIVGTGIALLDAVQARASEKDQRREAEQQAAIAQAVNEFLNEDLLAAVTPEGQGHDVTVREVLDKASEAIEGKFAGEPLVEASIRMTLGNTYGSLGEYTRAKPHLDRALELHRAELGNEHPAVADSLNSIAVLLRYKGDHKEAEPLFREALQITRKFLGNDHPDVAGILDNLAGLSYLKGDYTASESLYSDALRIWRETYGDDHPRVASSTCSQAGLLARGKGDYATAEPLLRRALDIHRKVLGNDHPKVADSLNNYAGVLHETGRHEAAEPLYREALAIRRRLFGNEHRKVAESLSNLALLLQDKGDYGAAEPLYREALDIKRKQLGSEHRSVALTLNNLAILRGKMGEFAMAEETFHEAIAMFRKLLGVHHPEVAFPLFGLGEVLVKRGDAENAEPILREALELRQDALAEDHWLISVSESVLGECLTALGRYDEAEVVLIGSHENLMAKLGTTHEHTIKALEAIAALYDAWGKPEEAAEWRAKFPSETTGREGH